MHFVTSVSGFAGDNQLHVDACTGIRDFVLSDRHQQTTDAEVPALGKLSRYCFQNLLPWFASQSSQAVNRKSHRASPSNIGTVLVKYFHQSDHHDFLPDCMRLLCKVVVYTLDEAEQINRQLAMVVQKTLLYLLEGRVDLIWQQQQLVERHGQQALARWQVLPAQQSSAIQSLADMHALRGRCRADDWRRTKRLVALRNSKLQNDVGTLSNTCRNLPGLTTVAAPCRVWHA